MWKICHTNKKCNRIHLSFDFIIIAISAEHNVESIDHIHTAKRMCEKMKINKRLNEIEMKLRPYYPYKNNGNVYLLWMWCAWVCNMNCFNQPYHNIICHNNFAFEYYIRVHQRNIAEYSTRFIGRMLRERVKCEMKETSWCSDDDG